MKKLLFLLLILSINYSLISQTSTCYSGQLLINSSHGFITVGGGHAIGDTLLFLAKFDGYKYVNTNTYRVDSIPFAEIDSLIYADSIVLDTNVWSTDTLMLPFIFKYFGCRYNSFKVSSNGIISFDPNIVGGSPINDTLFSTIPDTNYPRASIMSNFQSLFQNYPMFTYVKGIAPCREFIIYFDNASYNNDTCAITHLANSRIVLHESTNIIDIYTKSQNACSSINNGRAITGIQDYTGTRAYDAFGRNNNTYIDSNVAFRFYPSDTSGIVNKIVFIVNDTIRYDSAYVPFTSTYNLNAYFNYVLDATPIRFKAILYSVDTNLSICSNGLVRDSSGLGTGASGSDGSGEATNAIGIGGVGCNLAIQVTVNSNIYTDCLGSQISANIALFYISRSYPIESEIVDYGYLYRSGTYTYLVIDSYGCTASSVFEIHEIISEPPTISFSFINDAICTGNQGSVLISLFDGTPNFTITTAGRSYLTIFSQFVNNLSAGMHVFEVSDGNSCIAIDSVEIGSLYEPSFYDTTIYICPNSSIDLGYNIYSSAGVYFDTLSNYKTCDSIITTEIIVYTPVITYKEYRLCWGSTIDIGYNTYDSTGIYYDTLINFLDCDSVVITDLFVSAPEYDSSIVFEICDGYDVMFNGIRYDMAGSFTDYSVSLDGCDSVIYNIRIIVNYPVTYDSTFRICKYDNTYGFYVNSDTIVDFLLYNYKGCDSTYTIHFIADSVIRRGSYTVHVCYGDTILNFIALNDTAIYYPYINYKGCDSIYTYYIVIDPLPIVDLGSDTTIYDDENLIFNIPGYIAVWNTGDTTSSLTVSPFNSISYFVKVINPITNCISYDDINVIVQMRMTDFVIPNSFSPNGDGLNDLFFPLMNGYYYINEFKIFNRYGSIVFDNYGNNAWDGTYLDVAQPIDSYVYYLDIIQLDRTHKRITGTVNLVR